MPTVGIVGLLLAVGLVWKQHYRTIGQRPVNWGLAILSSWLLLTCYFANHRAAAFLGLANFLPYFLVFAAFSALIQTPSQLRQLARIWVIGSLPVVILGLGQLFWGWAGAEQLQGVLGWVMQPRGNPPGRMASVFMYANTLAAYLQMVFILGLGLWIERFQAWRKDGKKLPWQLLLLSLVVLGNAIALFLTSSRNAWAIAFLTCLSFALYLGWRWIGAFVALIMGSILWASFGPEPGRQLFRGMIPTYIWARLSDQLYRDRPVAQLRTTQWHFAWLMTQDRPWMGWGLRNFTPLYEAKMHLWLGHPHNLLLMLTAETGIPATILLFSLVGWILFQGVLLIVRCPSQWHQDRLILFTYLLAFGGCTLFNLVDITLFDLRVNTLGWLLLSAICGVVTHRHSR